MANNYGGLVYGDSYRCCFPRAYLRRKPREEWTLREEITDPDLLHSFYESCYVKATIYLKNGRQDFRRSFKVIRNCIGPLHSKCHDECLRYLRLDPDSVLHILTEENVGLDLTYFNMIFNDIDILSKLEPSTLVMSMPGHTWWREEHHMCKNVDEYDNMRQLGTHAKLRHTQKAERNNSEVSLLFHGIRHAKKFQIDTIFLLNWAIEKDSDYSLFEFTKYLMGREDAGKYAKELGHLKAQGVLKDDFGILKIHDRPLWEKVQKRAKKEYRHLARRIARGMKYLDFIDEATVYTITDFLLDNGGSWKRYRKTKNMKIG